MLIWSLECSPCSLHHPGAMKAHSGPVEVYLLAVKAHPGALKTGPGASEAYSGVIEARPGP
jgi:hypothetical protein